MLFGGIHSSIHPTNKITLGLPGAFYPFNPPIQPTNPLYPGIYGPFDKFVPVLKKDGAYVLLAEDEYKRLKVSWLC
jgi:hypothetical protein